MIKIEINEYYRETAERGHSLAGLMADNLEYSIYTENQEALYLLIKGLEKNHEIVYVRIYNAGKAVLADSVKSSSIQIPQISDASSALTKESTRYYDDYIDIVVPVVSLQGGFQDMLPLEKSRATGEQIIGYLQIGLTLKEAREEIKSFIISTAIFTVFLVLVVVALAIYLARKITSPIKELSLAAQEIAAGRFDGSVDINTKDEIADLAGSFNHMLAHLKDHRVQVESRTQELSEANKKLIEEIKVRKETMISLKATKAWLQHLLENTPAVMYSCKPYRDFMVTFISENVQALTGYSSHDFIEYPQQWAACIHKDDIWHFLNWRERALGSGKNSIEYRFIRKDGRVIWLYDELRLTLDSEGTPAEIVGYLIDVTNRKKLEEQLINDALHDHLTGLPNRALFLDRLNQALAASKRDKDYRFCVLFMDLDRFKKVNDSLGHVSGDKLLIAAAQRLKRCIREDETVARLGGDEFAVILTNISNIHDAEEVSNRINQEMAVPFDIDGQEIYLSISIGIAINDLGHCPPEQFLREADIAMYHAKGKGGGCHVLFDEPMHEIIAKNLRLETDLQHALERKEFYLQYQPIISLKTGQVKGFEALIRWKHPERGVVSPLEFIPLAEETGLIIQIGNWVLHEACRQMRIWQKEFPSDLPLTVSVNISSKHFTLKLIQYINEVLHETGLDASGLILEITESVIMENPEVAAKTLMKLKEMNVRLHIDDFGTGYSSLNYLQHFPVDALKIDKSFVHLIYDNKDKFEIVKLIITLAHNLNIHVVAEGVETVEQQRLLNELNCEYFQGYLFSKPLDAQAASDFLREGRSFM